jgi:soluble lytic murein transglycosylase-like protein
MLATGAARADVLAIGDDGKVTVNAGPAVYTSADLVPQPLLPQPDSRAARSARHAARMPAANPQVGAAIARSAARHGLSATLVAAVAWHESAFNVQAVSPKGARGVMQLMPETALRYCAAPCAAADNVEAGTAYLGTLLARYHNDIIKALAAYDAGPGAVDRFGGVPPYRETQDYVSAILAHMARIADTN